MAGGDWLDALPDGLGTEVGEHGSALSMGQRQLVALSRLLLQDPSIGHPRQATASVDPLTQAQISEGLDVALAGRTSIVIAHRLSTIEHADRIIVRCATAASSKGHARVAAAGRRRLHGDVYEHLLPAPVPRLPARHRVRRRRGQPMTSAGCRGSSARTTRSATVSGSTSAA